MAAPLPPAPTLFPVDVLFAICTALPGLSSWTAMAPPALEAVLPLNVQRSIDTATLNVELLYTSMAPAPRAELPLNVESWMAAMPPWMLIAPPLPVELFWKRQRVATSDGVRQPVQGCWKI